MGKIYIIGIAGKMASGKSTISKYLKAFISKSDVLDVDMLAKEIYCENPGLVKKLKYCLGECISNTEGLVDYKNLGRIVFSSREELEKLNAIMAPEIERKIKEFLENNKSLDCVIIDAAILFNAGIYKLCDLILWVTSGRQKRLKWLKSKTGMAADEALLRIDGQHIKYKRSLVDIHIKNDGSKESLEKEIFELAEKIKPEIYES